MKNFLFMIGMSVFCVSALPASECGCTNTSCCSDCCDILSLISHAKKLKKEVNCSLESIQVCLTENNIDIEGLCDAIDCGKFDEASIILTAIYNCVVSSLPQLEACDTNSPFYCGAADLLGLICKIGVCLEAITCCPEETVAPTNP